MWTCCAAWPSRPGMSVAIALHPLANPPDYVEIFQKYGVAIDRSLDITELFPLASVVIAHPSATNYLAETFAKPLVAYDLQRELESETDWLIYAAGTPYRGVDEDSLREAFSGRCGMPRAWPGPRRRRRPAGGFLSSPSASFAVKARQRPDF